VGDAKTDLSRLAELTADLGLHEHLCVIYDTRQEQFAAALPYLKAGLERGEKCLYFAYENTAAAVLEALRKGGTDVDAYLRSGALTITHKRETDLQQARFDPDWWIGFLNQATAEAGAAKFPALRILGDMDWPLRGGNSAGKFIEYESRINHFVRDHDVRVICQYNRKRLSPEFILGIIRTHPLVAYGGIVCKNPYYVPPDEFLKSNQASREVDRLLNSMLTWERSQQVLQHSEERLRLVIDTVPALIHTGRPDGYLDFFNQRWLDYVGLSLEDLSGWKWTAAIHPDDVAAMVERWRAALATGEPFEHEARVRRADGEYRWMVHSEVPLRDERGNIVKWYASSIDIEDRKRAETQSRTLIDAIPQEIWSGPPDGSNDFANERLRSYIGMSREEFRGDGWLKILHPDDRQRVVAAWHDSVVYGTPYEQEERHRGADGQYRWFLNRGVPLRDAEGRIVRWYGTNTDIENRKRAEDDLRKQKEILQKIFDNVPAMIRFVTPGGKTRLVNREWERTMGWTLEEILGQGLDVFAELYPDPKHRQEVEKFVFSSNPEFALRTRVRDGRMIDTSWASVRLSDGTAIAIGRDITERKRAEEALRASEERWRSVFENSAIGVALTDLNGHFLATNPVYQKMVGYDEEELRALSFLDITQEEYREANWRLIAELLEGKRQQFQIEKQYRRKDGSLIWVCNSVSLVPGTESVPRFIMALSEDITERMKAEEALQRSRDQLRALAARVQRGREEERTRLAREVHDELGQALTGIKLESASLIRELPGDARQQSDRAESIMKLADETIQAVRRISTELRPAILDDLGLVAAVEWAAQEFEARTGTECRLDLPKDDIVIDQERATALFRILQETLTNVARHANATQVRVRLARNNGNLSLEVQDNGRGFDEEEPSAGGHLGVLGMQERALLLGGQLTIDGVPGKGTTVRVRIPEAHRPQPE